MLKKTKFHEFGSKKANLATLFLTLAVDSVFCFQVQKIVAEAVAKAEEQEIKLPAEAYVAVLKETIDKIIEARVAADPDAAKYVKLIILIWLLHRHLHGEL